MHEQGSVHRARSRIGKLQGPRLFLVAGGCAAGVSVTGCVLDLAPPLTETELPSETDTDGTDGTDGTETLDDTDASVSEPDETETEATDSEPDGSVSEETEDETEQTDTEADADVPPEETDLAEAGTGCGPGQEGCDGACVPLGGCEPEPPPCEEWCVARNTIAECDGDVCTVRGCQPGFVDCDASLDMVLSQEEAAEENGCETLFDSRQSSDGPLVVPERTITDDTSWGGLAVYPMLVPCTPDDCGTPHPEVPAQVDLFQGVSPTEPSDLTASFSLAWDSTGMWIRALLIDDDLVTGRALENNAEGVPDPRVNDHIEFVFDGVNPSNYGDPQDHHLFTDFGEAAWDQRQSDPRVQDKVSVDVEEFGLCRILTAKLSENYLTSFAPESLMEAGNVFGFAIDVSDFDTSEDDPNEIQRQHQLFYEDPGPNYVFGQRDLPELVLGDPE